MGKQRESADSLSIKSPSKRGSSTVTFRVARLEPRLVLAIAGFTLWAGVVLDPGDKTMWLLAIYAAAVGAWCRMSPARRQSVMFARATLLLLGALMLETSVDVADPQGPYFIWPIMVTAVYSLMLSGRWLVGLWVLVILEFLCIHVFSNSTASWHLSFTQAGALAFFAFAATQFGNSVRDLDQRAERSRRDPNSRLYNEDGFFAHGGQLFDECRRRNRPFTLVLLHGADLREVAELAGKKAANQLFAQLVSSIESATPPDGLAARTDAVEFGIILPGVNAVRAAQLLHQELGQPPKIQAQLKGKRITVMLDSLVAETTSDVGSLEDMYDRLRAKLLKRAEVVTSVPPEAHSTLQGMLEEDALLPHYARPTLPMAYADSLPPGAH